MGCGGGEDWLEVDVVCVVGAIGFQDVAGGWLLMLVVVDTGLFTQLDSDLEPVDVVLPLGQAVNVDPPGQKLP